MAKRRIFEVDFMQSDNFCGCTQAQKLLYIYICLSADDEGFCSATMTARFLAGASEQDVKELMARGLIIKFDSGVVCVKHWYVHNLKTEKMAKTKFQKERELLEVSNNVYQFLDNSKKDMELSKNFQEKEEKSKKSMSQSNLTKDKLIQVNKEEIDKEESGQVSDTQKTTRFIPPKQDEVESYIKDNGYHVNAERFCLFYESKGWMVGKNKMKDWKACVRTWEQKWKEEHPTQEEVKAKPQPTGNHSFDADEFFALAVAKQRSKG